MFNYLNMIWCATKVSKNKCICSICSYFTINIQVQNNHFLCNIKNLILTYLLLSWPIFMTGTHYSHNITVCNCITSVTMMMVTRSRSRVTHITSLLSCSGVEVGWVRLSRKWILVWECMRIWVDQPNSCYYDNFDTMI